MRSRKLIPRTIAEILRDTLRQLEATTDLRKDEPTVLELRVHLLRTLRTVGTPSETQPTAPPAAD